MNDVKGEVQELLRLDIGDDLLEVKKVFFQDTLWDSFVEVVAVTASNKVFSALYDVDRKMTKFKQVPAQEGK